MNDSKVDSAKARDDSDARGKLLSAGPWRALTQNERANANCCVCEFSTETKEKNRAAYARELSYQNTTVEQFVCAEHVEAARNATKHLGLPSDAKPVDSYSAAREALRGFESWFGSM
jgi:hypothetical protein